VRAYRYRYAVYGFLIAASYCGLLFVLHYIVSDGTPGQLLREFPAAAILVFVSLPVCLITGYLLGAERDRRKATALLNEKYEQQSESLEELSALLAHSEEMRQMAGIAAGEMKHPLTSIVGYALTLREYWDKFDDEKKRAFVDYIKISSSRLEAMSNDLLRIMELSKGFPRPQIVSMNLNEIIDEVCGTLEDIYAERGLRIALRFHGDIPLMQSDPSQFFDLCYNLLDICMRCSEDNNMISVWCSFKAPKLTLHLRCHKSALGSREIVAIRIWPPQEKETEMATLSMEYRLASAMVRETGGELRLETVGESGFSFFISFFEDR
jgi:K+-sensing histidine kinase KdpD